MSHLTLLIVSDSAGIASQKLIHNTNKLTMSPPILKILDWLASLYILLGGGDTRMARGGIGLVHGLAKSTLIMYYSCMKKDPKYAFLHTFFLICLSCSFQMCLYDQKHTNSNFARFCTSKRCTRVECLVLKNNPNYVNFWTSLIPLLTFEWPPGILLGYRDWHPVIDTMVNFSKSHF